jgi:hypothetical protein
MRFVNDAVEQAEAGMRLFAHLRWLAAHHRRFGTLSFRMAFDVRRLTFPSTQESPATRDNLPAPGGPANKVLQQTIADGSPFGLPLALAAGRRYVSRT